MTPLLRFVSPALAGVLFLSGCGPNLVPVTENGQLLPDRTSAIVAQGRADAEVERGRLGDERTLTAAGALATCGPEVCDAVTRGEVVIGMTEAQVLAATRTTSEAWDIRDSGGMTLMTIRPGRSAPGDAVGELAFVSFENGAVSGYTYREPQGFRTVTSAADATLTGRAEAQAEALVRQGDEYAAAGRLDLALERYDRADVIRPGDPETTLRIASTLDKQLRPYEATMRYQLFIHQMELEKIEARGEVAARMAEAIARARERVIILEQR